MRKIGNWIYAGLTILLILFFTFVLLNRYPGGTPVITVGRQQETLSSRSLPEAGTAAAGKRININTADLETLKTLPGIGDAKAQAILDYRQAHGPFRSVSGLLEVRGIGEGILRKIMDSICLEDENENIDH